MDLTLTDGGSPRRWPAPPRDRRLHVVERAPGDGRLGHPAADRPRRTGPGPAHHGPARPRRGRRRARRALRDWAPFACSLAAMRSQGVRDRERLARTRGSRCPTRAGRPTWVCTRAETWRGGGTRVLAQFHTPGGTYGAVAAKAENVAGLRAARPARAGRRAVEVGGGRVVPARGRRGEHGVDHGDGRGERVGPGRLAGGEDQAGGAGRAEGDPGGRAGHRGLR